MEREDLVTLTADIVAAHLSNNNVAISDVSGLIERVFGALAGLGGEAEPEEQPKQPAVPVRSSVKPEYLVCLECGRKQKTLKRHLMTAHNLTAQQYRDAYNLPVTYPMTAPDYSERRRTMAKAIGLGRKKEDRPAGRKVPSSRSKRS